jgi:hypothetical protein
MFDWLKNRESMTPEGTADEDAARRRGRHMSGKYRSLYEYLEHRYASTVVLTFAQIEDLVGFPLPDRARTDAGWWTAVGAGTAEAGYSQAWTLTQRTARPNLLAKNVVFERVINR